MILKDFGKHWPKSPASEEEACECCLSPSTAQQSLLFAKKHPLYVLRENEHHLITRKDPLKWINILM